MAGCETLLLLDLHRAVKFHYEMRQHLDRYLGQDVFNSVLMGVRCHPAHQDILCAIEGSSSGQMKTWSCSFSKWSLITYHTLHTVLRVHGVQQQLRQGPGPQEFTLQPRMDGWMWNVHSRMMHMYVESSANTKVEKGAAEEVMGVLRRV